uniref:Uncharacterized protein n=1 Tax=Cacopsylla melanoneura TaxID=428564 RepID=A0A8D8X9T9_9HEMI
MLYLYILKSSPLSVFKICRIRWQSCFFLFFDLLDFGKQKFDVFVQDFFPLMKHDKIHEQSFLKVPQKASFLPLIFTKYSYNQPQWSALHLAIAITAVQGCSDPLPVEYNTAHSNI